MKTVSAATRERTPPARFATFAQMQRKKLRTARVRAASARGAAVPRRRRRSSTSAAEELDERLAEVVVEDRVEDRIDGRVGIAEPEEDGVQLSRDLAVGPEGVDDVRREEADPHSEEEGNDDRHPLRRSDLALLAATIFVSGTPGL